MFEHVLGGSIHDPNTPETTYGVLLEYDQEEFFTGAAIDASMDTTGKL